MLLVNQHNIPEKCFYDRKSLNNHIQHKCVRDMEYFFLQNEEEQELRMCHKMQI